ncbi:MAG: hypothetical protein ABIH67_02870 [Candidatus Uhrbacteria bacterium]
MAQPSAKQMTDFWKRVAEGHIDRGMFQAFLDNPHGCTLSPCQIHVPHLIPETDGKKWDVIEDVELTELEPNDLEFFSFLKGDEAVVNGDTMRSRAVQFNGNLGLSDTPRLLEWLNQLDEDPRELQGKYIVLPGTVLRGLGGGLLVPCLLRDGGRWVLSFGWLGDDWDDDGRLACRK